ncbi:MAG: guanylate kinase [Candidatus Omnitrophota bacterium]|nr:guanylate kinase [Candidatus Omnitrophota bacterium]
MIKKIIKPKVFVFSGPGGVGKTTLVNRLFLKAFTKKNFIKGISYTTRKKRVKEKEGIDYLFISKNEFLELKEKKRFLESEKVLDQYYGTPRFLFEAAKKENKGLILCIDVKGGMYLKNKLKQGTIVTIFISAPTKEDLYHRLGKRDENQKVIEKRIRLAKKELTFAKHYDYVIVNQDIKSAVTILEAILLSEQVRQ